MKKYAIVIFVLIHTTVYAQTKAVFATHDSTVTINTIYAGLLSWNNTKIDTFSNKAGSTVRFGGSATWLMSEKLLFNVFGAYEINGTPTPLILTQFRLQFNPTRQWKLSIGNIASPVTEQRPYPVSAAGQFETWTMAQIPGLAPGAKASYAMNDYSSMSTGIAIRQGRPEYNLATQFKAVSFGAYYRTADNSVGSAVTIQTNQFSCLVVYQSNHVVANTTTYTFKNNICVYNDSGLSLQTNAIIHWQTGIVKKFTADFIGGLIGGGYDAKQKVIYATLFVHL